MSDITKVQRLIISLTRPAESHDITYPKVVAAQLRKLADELDTVQAVYELYMDSLPQDLEFRFEYKPDSRHAARQLKEELGLQYEPSYLLYTPDRIYVSSEAKSFLKRASLQYLGQMVSRTTEEMHQEAKRQECKPNVVDRIEKKLKGYGLHWGMDIHPDVQRWFESRIS